MATVNDPNALLSYNDLGSSKVDVPGVGTVNIRGLSALESTHLQSMRPKDGELEGEAALDFIAHTIIAGAVKDNGDPLFTSDHIEGLKRKGNATLRVMFDEIMRLNGVDISEDGDPKD